MLEDYTFWLMIIAIILAYVCVAVAYELALSREEARQRRHQGESPGQGIDVSSITPRVHQVRENYAAALHTAPRAISVRTGLVAASRRFIANLPFFRDAKAEHEIQRDEV